MTFGQYVRHQREAQKMTLTELARRAKVSTTYLSRIEREREDPPLDYRISALASALSLPLDDLYTAARRLPPDLRAHTGDVIVAYRQRAGGKPASRQKSKTPILTADART
jgi:transcriptional regulator with XRE-family HTH domain